MKIAFLSLYSGEVSRGAETYVHELANQLTKRGHEVCVYQNGPKVTNSLYKTAVVGLSSHKNSHTSGIPFLNAQSLLIKKFTQRVLLQIDPETQVVVPTNGQWQSVLCKLWCIQHKKALVISGQSGRGYDDRINLWTFPHSFVSLSTSSVLWAKLANPFVSVAHIPNGVDLSKFTQNKKQKSTKTPVVLTVGALVPEKRIELTIQAVSLLPSVQLRIVGSGPLKEKLQDLAKKYLPDRYSFLEVSHEKMPEIYRDASLFTLVPASSESFGIVYLEALASGLPAVAPEDETRKEIIGDAGILIDDATDIPKYAKVLSEALSKQWGDKPRKQALKFSWDDIAQKYEKLFISLIH